MKRIGMTRQGLAVVVLGSLVLGAFAAAPADAKRKKKPASCTPYVPGEKGSGAETTIVTDAHTESNPATTTVTLGPGITVPLVGIANDTVYTNVQVDTTAKEKPLFVRIEFEPYFDYDLGMERADGRDVAYEYNFNPLGPFPIENKGAHAEMGASQIDGYVSKDCAGFTVFVITGIAAGGEYPIAYWLGE